MFLSSPSFVLFLLAVSLLYFLLPGRFQRWVVLSASVVFYSMNTPQYLPLIFVTSLWAFLFGKKINLADSDEHRKRLTVIGVSGIAFLFILFRFFSKELCAWTGKTILSQWFVSTSGPVPSLIWPVGISFYSLSLIGYLIDINDKKIPGESSFLIFINYVMFFPTILSGPINRAEKLLPQFRCSHSWSYGNTVSGLRRFLIGAVKKVVLADGISLLVNGVWDNLKECSGVSLILIMFLYSLQLYGDFSGYSDMALGTARILGFEIEENFTAPFMAQSFSELWSRWHNSLSGWLKTYIYIPLGGGKKGFPRKVLNIFIVFIISGMWHGVTNTFIVWGLLTALIRVFDELIYRNRNYKAASFAFLPWVRRAGVFVIFSLVFVFFRAETFDKALLFFRNLFCAMPVTDIIPKFSYFSTDGIADGVFYSVLYWGGLLFGLIFTVWSDLFVYNNPDNEDSMLSSVKKSSVRMILYWISGILVMMFYFIQYTKTSGSVSFIYAGF